MINILNINPNIDTLNVCVKSANIALITNILKYKIIPTYETFENLISSQSKTNIPLNPKRTFKYSRRRSSRRRGSRKNKSKENLINQKKPISKIMSIVNLLTHNGLKINFDCVNLLLSINEHIENLENHDIEYNEDLYFACYINNHYPSEYMEKSIIDKNVLKLRGHLHKEGYNMTNAESINFIKANNIKFDNYMLEYVCIDQNNEYIKKICNEHNCIPSLSTLFRVTNNGCTKKVFKNFINSNGITKETMQKTFEINF
jgi:hypothetical protein